MKKVLDQDIIDRLDRADERRLAQYAELNQSILKMLNDAYTKTGIDDGSKTSKSKPKTS